MKASKIRELTTEELNERERELKTELFNLRFQNATGQLSNPQRIKECRHDIARVKTLLRERQVNAAAK